MRRKTRTAQATSVGDWYLVPGTERTDNAFRYALWSMAQRLEGDVNAYASVASLESGLNPQAVNKMGGASGLFQFIPSTAKRLGTSVEAIRKMSGIQQIPYIEKFFQQARGVTDPGTLYMYTFLPAFARRPDSFVLGEKDSTEKLSGGLTKGAVYSGNWGFDSDKDGIFTVGNVKSKARGRYNNAKAKGSIPIYPESPSGRDGGFAGALLLVALTVPVGALIFRR